tara:strand:+ start:70 stop:438 length:369 start_codon:yes stop_codon:yes gene_type:complete
MAIYNDNWISFNLNELVSIRSSFLEEEISEEDIEEVASKLRRTLTWDTMYGMIDSAILEYLDRPDPNKPNYGEISPPPGWEAKLNEMEKEKKAREKYVKEHFEMVTLDGGSWQIEVPRRIKE